MKALAIADSIGRQRFSSHQVYYSLIARELEHELIPLALDQGIGVLVWSPLSGGWLSGKYRRNATRPPNSRVTDLGAPGPVDEEHVYRVIDALDSVVAGRSGATVAQAALAWLTRKPGVTSVIVGARDREQLVANLQAADLSLTDGEVLLLDEASSRPLPYPYWHQYKYNSERQPHVPRVRRRYDDGY
jgi:aryl-alcohol dehydrogenase-like predicted oxidoreductase